ncbi:putative LRR receptor-like serine/threonine-protein kinase [Planoprotostelium fungivorum]|uniref:Putative LRR receptor-like serine/threonine-protein kinase n=1 Tax=Planoprotostelium fungivorum TaxID=1890364 RepID=A0A2P6NTU4_9EUKA|nr:putative LRR receptor-like serine/threonine-protein kinase [Planoprotostelium fungivorum]
MRGALFLSLLALVAAQLNQTCLQQRLSDVKNLVTPMRGVNLGSWFVAEYYMVPHLWTDNNCDPSVAQGQYLLERCLDQTPGTLEQHWSTWINETDFATMAAQGINTVRLPIGWWQIYDTKGGAASAGLSVNPNNYAPGALKYIDLAFQWGAQYGISILLDLHAAPGSQNAQPHSAPPYANACDLTRYLSNLFQAKDSVEAYTSRYSNQPAFLGFAILNEPGCPNLSPSDYGNQLNYIEQYYQLTYGVIRKYCSTCLVVISPMTIPIQTGGEDPWPNFMSDTNQYKYVYMDLHSYQCFGGVGGTDDEKIQNVYDVKAKFVTDYNKVNPKPLMIGEWSLCGVSAGKEWQLANAQLQAWTQAKGGWTYWSWKAAGSAWSMSEGYRQGWFQSNATGLPSCVISDDPFAISSIYTSPWSSVTPTSTPVPTTSATLQYVPEASCSSQRLQSVKNYSVPVRASSLYGWFVVDSTLTPELWTENNCTPSAAPGTWLLQKCLGNKADGVFQRHWAQFVDESDFEKMAMLGLNSVRIPLGWWNIFDSNGGGMGGCPGVNPSTFSQGSLHYLDLAFRWAEKWDLGIILDMHAAPGGQNAGEGASSPNIGAYYFSPYESNIYCMTHSLESYMYKYGSHPNFIGISVIDNPDGANANLNNYIQYYQAAYGIVRKYSNDSFVVIDIPSDQSVADPNWINLMTGPSYYNIWFNYQIDACLLDSALTDDDKIYTIANKLIGNVAYYNSVAPNRPLFIDGWGGCGVSLDHTAQVINASLSVARLAKGGWSFDYWPYSNKSQNSMQSMFDFGSITPAQTDITLCPVSTVTVVPDTGCPDCNALTDLYTLTGGPQWTDSLGWSLPITNSAQYCSFSNVICDRYGRVLSISFYGNNLIGSLSESFGDMTHLTLLTIVQNFELTGSIPSSVSKLVNMLYVDLSNNGFTGSIPSGFGAMKNVQYVYLNNNELSGSIPMALSGMSDIKELNLNSNQLSGKIPDFIYNMTKLEAINLYKNRLTGAVPNVTHCYNLRTMWVFSNLLDEPLSESICLATQLSDFQFHTNAIPGTIPACLWYMPKMQTVFGSNNKLTGEIPELNAVQLTRIYLGQNLFSGPFPPVYGLVNLQTLSMAFNFFHGPIPSWVGNMTTLVDLTMVRIHYDVVLIRLQNNNYFNGTIPQSLNQLTSLQSMNLANNLLTGQIPDVFSGMTILFTLDLSFNLLTGRIPSSVYTIPLVTKIILNDNHLSGSISVFNNSQLLVLQINNNRLSGQFMPPVTPKLLAMYASNNSFTGSDWKFLGQLPYLQLLELSDNFFSGRIDSISSSSISRLVLRNNSFSGSFPNYNSLQLNYVDVSHNQFSGDLSTLIGVDGAKALQRVYLNNNRFSGFLPPQISGCTYLQIFDATNNDMFGEVPSSISSMYSLNVLRLGGNNFQGALPDMSSLINLQDLSINNNRLVSNLAQLTSLTQLTSLDLSNNPLNSSIPSSIVNLLNLKYLNLSGCGLHDDCPPQLWNIRSMMSLDLRGNTLSGQIPDILSDPTYIDLTGNSFNGSTQWMLKLGAIQYLSLQGNRFQGDLPDLSSFKSARYINFAGNQLTGTISSSSVSGLFQLSSVDLSSNGFSGAVPQFSASVQHLNISHNHFSDVSKFSLPSLVSACDMQSNSFECPVPLSSRSRCNATCTTTDVNITSQYRMRINGTLATWNETAYLIAISTVLSADIKRFQILQVREGSVIIDGTISPPADGSDAGSAPRLLDLLNQPTTQTSLSQYGVSVLNFTDYIPATTSADELNLVVETVPSQIQPSSGVSKGVIIGVSIGGTLLVLILIGAIVALAFRKRHIMQVMHQTIDLDNVDLGAAKKSIIDYAEISDMKEIGSGAFGIVFKGTWRELNVAVKQIRSEHVTREQVESFLKEVAILQNLRSHPNVVLFIGLTIPPQPLTMITEFCEGGGLFEYLRQNTCDINMKIGWCNGIALGMLHLHKENVVHRDVSRCVWMGRKADPEQLAVRNILLTKHLEPKVTDFGMSRVTEAAEEGGSKTNTNIGPVKWMAPEALKERKYSNKSDVWSFGVVIWEIINVIEPFPDLSPVEAAVAIVAHGKRLDIPDTDANLQMLMRICWSELPEDRPNFAQIVRSFTVGNSLVSDVDEELLKNRFTIDDPVDVESVDDRSHPSIYTNVEQEVSQYAPIG